MIIKNGRMDFIKNCTLCPRLCGAARLEGRRGFCGAGKTLKAARAALHNWEEPCVSGERGSGAVFFSHCPLGCVYCQNRLIGACGDGLEITVARLGEIFIELQDKGAHNINLITPDHWLPHILDALDIAKAKGLFVPVVYNCSGYQTEAALHMLNGYIDVYLPDFKYWDDGLAIRYSNAPGYSGIAQKAVGLMVQQAGKPVFDKDGMMLKGVIVRHLMLPGLAEDSKKIVKYLYQTYGNAIFMSIMNQYTPIGMEKFPELARKVTQNEYDGLVDYAVSLGVENAYIQEGGTASESFIPPFDYEGILSAD